MGSVTQQLATAAINEGVVVTTGCKVGEVEVEGGVAKGVVLEDGRRVAAKAVVGGCGEWLTLLLLLVSFAYGAG